MKSLISIIAVILVVILAMGAISSLTEGVGSGGGVSSSTSTAATTTSSVDGGGNANSDGGINLAEGILYYDHQIYYDYGETAYLYTYSERECLDANLEASDGIVFGKVPLDSGAVMLVFAITGLVKDKTYNISLMDLSVAVDYDAFYWRVGNSGEFAKVNSSPRVDGQYTFMVSGVTSFQIGVMLFEETPSDEVLAIYANAFMDNMYVEVKEVLAE